VVALLTHGSACQIWLRPMEIIPKAGHIPQVEQTEATHAVVSAFLS
jgi:pimeloyl-ACP methyl ester carboxylesterase